jgi:hypothetical protein
MLNLELCVAAHLFLSAMGADGSRRRWLELGAGAVVGIAYLTTEVGALMLAVFYLHLVLSKRLRTHDGWLLGGFALVFAGEVIYHTAVHGHPLFRFAFGSEYLRDPMLVAANSNLPYRLLKVVPRMFLYPSSDLGIYGPLLLLAGVYAAVRPRTAGFFVVWGAAVLLFYNFMTVSFQQYVVLPVTARLLSPACLPLVALLAKLVVDAWRWGASLRTPGARPAFRTAIVVGLALLARSSLLAMALDTSPTVSGAAVTNATTAAAFMRGYRAVTVVTDRTTARALQFYRGFNQADTFSRFATGLLVSAGRQGDAPVFVVLNGPVVHEGQLTGEFYGSGVSLDTADLSALAAFMSTYPRKVLSARLPRSEFLAALLRFSVSRRLLGPWRLRLPKACATSADSTSCRYSPIRRSRDTELKAGRGMAVPRGATCLRGGAGAPQLVYCLAVVRPITTTGSWLAPTG